MKEKVLNEKLNYIKTKLKEAHDKKNKDKMDRDRNESKQDSNEVSDVVYI